jgi:hypothetical protein
LSSLSVRGALDGGNRSPFGTLKLVTALAAAGMLFGAIAGQLIATGHGLAVVGLAAVVLPVAMWKRPHLSAVVLLTAALLIEQVGQTVEPVDANAPGAGAVTLTANIPLTSHIPLFRGLGSLHLELADLLLLLVAGIYLARSAQWGGRRLPSSQVATAVFALVGAVLLGTVIGISHHGSFRVSLMEARPYFYLAATFVFTAMLVRERAAVRAMLWALVLATGFKALQGIYVYFSVRHMHPRPESVLGHEEAFFFAVYLFLAAALWLFGVRGRLRRTATWLLPLVMGADLVNNRRAAWLLVGAGILALAAIGYRSLPQRKRAIGWAMLVLTMLSAVYVPLYWNKTGGMAQPARALRSLISPDPRDAASDLYRLQENANLKLNIHEGGLLGRGSGVPIDYALPIVDLKQVDPLISYIPHNGVLYVLMRFGLLGAVAMWALLGCGIIAGCRLARSADRELAVVGAVVVCALISYALEGATDQGFFFYRIAFVTGSLLGLAEAARRLARPG